MTSSLFRFRESRIAWLIYTGLIAVLTIVAFSDLAHLQLDDHDDETFSDNLSISQDFSFFFSTEKQLATGRPVAELVKYLAYLIGGNDPTWFHLFAVFLHSLASLLLAAACRRLGASLELSFTGGLLFLFNVTHFQAVHWISALDYPLALIWSLAALLCYLRCSDTDRRGWQVLFIVFLVLGLFSHISSIAMWPFCLYWTWHKTNSIKKALRQLVPAAVSLLPMLIVAIHITQKESSTWESIDEFHAGSGAETIPSQRWYLLMWFLSRLLTTAHWLLLDVYKLQSGEIYLGAGVFAVLMALIWKKRLPGALWATWVLLSLLPFVAISYDLVLNLPTGPSRYLYMASAGSSILLAWGIQWLSLQFKSAGRYLYAGLVTALLGSSYIALDKTEALSLFTSGRYYLARGDHETGIAQLKRAIAQSPNTIPLEDTYARLCMILISRGDDVESVLDKALEHYPDNPTLNVYRLVIDSMHPDISRQQDAMRKLKTSAAAAKQDGPIIASAYFNLGLSYRDRNDHQQAVVAYQRALEFNPGQPKILKLLAHSHMALGHSEGFEAVLERIDENAAEDSSANYASLYYNLGNIYFGDSNFAQAAAAYRQAINLNSEDDRSYNNLGAALRSMGQLQEAEKAYQEAIDRQPGNPLHYHSLGGLALERNEFQQALTAFEKAAEYGSSDVETYSSLAYLYQRLDQREKSLQHYRYILETDLQNTSARTYTQVGLRLDALNRRDLSTLAYQKALELDGGDATAHNNLGWNFYLAGDLDAAIEQYQLILATATNSLAQFNLGLAYLNRGDIDTAVAAYTRGVEQYGADEAARIGAVDDLKNLIATGVHAVAAQKILNTHWPQ